MKTRYLKALLRLFQDHPEFKLTYQKLRFRWVWWLLRTLKLGYYQYPENLGKVFGKTLYLDGEPGDSAWQTASSGERYAFLRFVSRFFRERKRHGIGFSLKFVLWAPFRLKVKKACYTEVICACVEQSGVVGHINRIRITDALWETARHVAFCSWDDLYEWVDARAWEAYRLRKHSLDNNPIITLDSQD